MNKFISSANITVTDDTGTITVNSITFCTATAAGQEYVVEGWVKLA